MKIQDITHYIKNYNTEEVLFNEVGPEIRKRGFMKFDEFYKICMWKSVRPKKRYIQNNKIVENITKKAFSENNEANKMLMLTRLNGVGIPTASAILTIVFPNKYSVIDIRCIESLNFLGYKISKVMTIKNWLEYIKIMRKLAEENNVTPRQMDMALFTMHKEKLQNEGYKNLYKINFKR